MIWSADIFRFSLRLLKSDVRSNDCTDIDECRTGSHKCSVNIPCKNTIGSYLCEEWCKSGSYKWTYADRRKVIYHASVYSRRARYGFEPTSYWYHPSSTPDAWLHVAFTPFTGRICTIRVKKHTTGLDQYGTG